MEPIGSNIDAQARKMSNLENDFRKMMNGNFLFNIEANNIFVVQKYLFEEYIAFRKF